MAGSEPVARRLGNLRLDGELLESPEDVVGWLVAVQSQEFSQARWPLEPELDRYRAFHTGPVRVEPAHAPPPI